MGDRITLFADVIVPIPVPNLYTYRIPADMNEFIAVGVRVAVKFGKSGYYTAIVRHIHENPPKAYQARYIEAIIDDAPVVLEHQFKFWEWIANYYICNIGEVMNAALPSGLKLDFEHFIEIHPDFDEDYSELNDRAYLVAEAVMIQKKIKLKDVQEILGIKTVQPIIKDLLSKKVIILSDELREKYKPKTESFVAINSLYNQEEQLHELLDSLQSKKAAQGQLEVVMGYLHLRQSGIDLISKKDLLEFCKSKVSSLNTLIKKEVFVTETREINRLSTGAEGEIEIKSLTEDQQIAYEKIKNDFIENKSVLLHGVTSSGKTEIYVKLIEDCLNRGEQVLYMLPEIALTTQLISRLHKYFGDRIGVYHSRFSQNERVEVWNRVSQDNADRFDIVMGARSSLFLPFQNLGLVIIDEEHENTFKQYDPAPRYHARDAAIVLASQHSANVILGSATPSLESYWNAKNDKFSLVELNRRFGDVRMPEILCADLKKENREKTMKSHFSSFLLQQLDETLERKEQAIFFQNRRGYTPMWVCEDCGWVPQCTRCDVSLTYHKQAHLLTCHYCGYATHPPKKCDACGSSRLQMKGFGTEKIEDELQIIYPDLRISRMDLDTTRAKSSYQNIIEAFDNHEIDVLIGTQMVSKGLDFDNVGLVGILNADQMLNFPDFRSFERAYQLMVQVSGRAGRKEKRGKVVIQTFNPDHWIIRQVIDNDYQTMYNQEIFERKSYSYPPFFRLIEFTFKHKDKDTVRAGAEMFADQLKKVFKNRVYGPQDPLIARINNYYLKTVMLKLERELSVTKVREQLGDMITAFNADSKTKSVRIVVDVDPV